MPTGPKHQLIVNDPVHGEGITDCRCTIGEDHFEGEASAASNHLSETDADEIWRSSGMDEDYDFR